MLSPTLQGLVTNVTAEIADAQAIVQGVNDLSAANDSLTSQLSASQAQVVSLQQQLAAVNLDDVSAQAQVVALTQQLQAAQAQVAALQAQLAAAPSALVQKRFGLFEKLVNAQFNLHRLPFVTDPNARPILQWFQPGNSGNTGGASATTHGTWSITANADGSTDFAMQPIASYDDFIWGLNFTESAVPMHHAIQITEFEVSDADLPSLMGIETNFEHSLNSFRFNAGIQALLGVDKDAITGALVTNQWRYYDIFAGHWFNTGIPFDRTMFGTGKHIELISEFVQSDDPTVGMTNLRLTINGTTYAVNKTTKAKATPWGPYLQQGFQEDSLISAAAAKVKVWNMETYWV